MPRLRTISLIGALLLSTSTVHASQTFKEITQPCKASEETENACDAMAIHFSAITYYSFLCMLKQAGKTLPEMFPEQAKVSGKTERKKAEAKVPFNAAVKKVKNKYPNYPIKPMP